MKVIECCQYAPKSPIKAGDAVSYGEYMFFTSSSDESKRFSDYLFDGEGIIMGTGGNATLHYYNGRYAVSTDCLVILPDERIRCKFLYYFFMANMDVLERGFKGAGLRHTNKQYIGDIELGEIPSLDCQMEVIKILDKIEKIIAMKNEQMIELDNLIKSRFVEMFGDPFTNPMKWDKCPLGKECEIITGNTPSRKVSAYYGDYIEWIKSDNINTPNAILTTAEEYLSEEGLKVGRCVDAGAILMTCIAGSLGCIGNVAIADRQVSFNQQINGIIPRKNNTWFMYVLFELSKKGIQSSINMALKGILSKGQLAEIEFIFPPIDLQNEFADFVEQVEKTKVAVQKSLTETQLLFDSLMQQYFG